jgi:hypothetical protein
MLVMLVEVGQLQFRFLSAPRGGLPAIQANPSDGDASRRVSTVHMASLTALILTLAAEVIALVPGLWLLFRITSADRHVPETAAD